MSAKTATKKTKVKESKLDKANLKRLTANRETKYNYPKDATTPEDRKAFRRRARQKVKSLTKAIASEKGENKAKAKAELAKFEETVYA